MKSLKADDGKNTDRLDGRPFTETDEFGHERNEVAKAQKQAASQETAGLMEPQQGR